MSELASRSERVRERVDEQRLICISNEHVIIQGGTRGGYLYPYVEMAD